MYFLGIDPAVLNTGMVIMSEPSPKTVYGQWQCWLLVRFDRDTRIAYKNHIRIRVSHQTRGQNPLSFDVTYTLPQAKHALMTIYEQFLRTWPITRAVLEGHAYGVTNSQSIFQLAEAIGTLKHYLITYWGIPQLSILPTSTIRKSAAGKGNIDVDAAIRICKTAYGLDLTHLGSKAEHVAIATLAAQCAVVNIQTPQLTKK